MRARARASTLRMAYRGDLMALEERLHALERELEELRETEARREAVEREIGRMRTARDALRARRPLRVLRAPRIALPCDVPWETMEGGDLVRSCKTCQKRVYNLSGMTRLEAEGILAREEAACIRYYERPDGTLLTSDCPVGARRRRTRRRKIAVSGTLVAGALVSAMTAASAPEPVYLRTVDSLLAGGDALRRHAVRVEGTLVPGSLEVRDAQHEVRFMLESKGVAMAVRYGELVLPDSFRDEPAIPLSVLVEGELGDDGIFHASHVMPRSFTGYTLGSHFTK